MESAFCSVPVSPLRADPSHRSEMVSQLVFGERCDILEYAPGEWLRIKCLFDGYEGWCQDSHITETDPVRASEKEEESLTQDWVTMLEFNGHPMYLPLGSSLTGLKSGHTYWRKNIIHYRGSLWEPAKAQRDARSIKHLAFQFLNTPYLWGGKTVFGTDCSGFTQTVFHFFNSHLSRDAWQQAEQGTEIGSLKESRLADLAFFDNDDGKIVHVGILLNDQEIIHASGKVRVDRMDSRGIIHSEKLEHTHHLKVIKRFF
jgi:gamma-D-glutamyl-L-lysine dipeptidyl-peptidase